MLKWASCIVFYFIIESGFSGACHHRDTLQCLSGHPVLYFILILNLVSALPVITEIPSSAGAGILYCILCFFTVQYRGGHCVIILALHLVSAAPIITEIPSSIGVDILTNATMPCSAIGLPTPKIVWLSADGSEIDFSGRFSQNVDGALMITGEK